MLLTLGAHPAETVDRLQPEEIPVGLESVVHRWVSGKDLSYLLGGIRGLRKRHGNLGRAFLAGDNGGESLLTAMTAFAQGVRRFKTERREVKPLLHRLVAITKVDPITSFEIMT